MQIRHAIYVAVGVVLLVVGGAAAQERHGGAGMPASEVEVRSADGRVSIPFELKNNHVIIPILVNGSKFDVVLDTGMPMDGLMLYGSDRVDGLGLKYAGFKAHIGGAGGEGDRLEADIAMGVTIDVGDLRLRNATTIVSPPLHHFTSYHDGVIGASLFNNFVVDINYDDGRIGLHDPAAYVPAANAVSVPLTFEHNVPYAEVTVTTDEGKVVPLHVVVDLGASHGISLNAGTTGGIGVPARAIRTVIGRGVSGEVRGRVGRVQSLELGGVSLAGVVATFPDDEHQHPRGMDSRNGNLGDGVLQRFNVAFDYAHRRMLLVRNERFAEPFEWDMSGIGMQPDGDAALRIASIVDGSPAAKAGLAVDDLVTHVDGRAVSPADLFAIREQMKQAGKEIEITATRDGKPIEVRLKLRRMV
ncbi:MAG TPA: aspartyl protease family protein [Candidatus Polarisedimenticolia bacterium]|nr:aspartyl protease family protein [Candidatus Polarisedimenticolia bacterium]